MVQPLTSSSLILCIFFFFCPLYRVLAKEVPLVKTFPWQESFATSLGGLGVFETSEDKNIFYHMATVGKKEPLFIYRLYVISLEKEKIQKFFEGTFPLLHSIILYGYPPTGLITVAFDHSEDPVAMGEGSYIAIALGKPYLPYKEFRGSISILSSLVGRYIFDLNKKHLLEFGFPSLQFQGRPVVLPHPDEIPVFIESSSQKSLYSFVSSEKGRGVGIYDRDLSRPLTFIPLVPEEKLLPLGEAFGSVYLNLEENAFILTPLPQKTESKKRYTLSLPSGYPVSEGRLMVHRGVRSAFVIGRRDNTNQKWRKLFFYPVLEGPPKEVSIEDGLYIQDGFFHPSKPYGVVVLASVDGGLVRQYLIFDLKDKTGVPKVLNAL